MTTRQPYLDIAKGISILLVALGHSWALEHAQEPNSVLGSFRTPLFFFVAGLFFRHQKRFIDIILDKSDALLKPFFVTLTALGVLHILNYGVNPLRYFALLAYGNGRTIEWVPMWFLPHLWLVFVFAWLLVRFTRLDNRGRAVQLAVLATLLVSGYWLMQKFWNIPVEILGKVRELPGLPFSADLVFVTSFYFLLGFVLRDSAGKFTFRAVPFWLVVGAFVALHWAFDYSINFNMRRYDHLLFSTAAALAGIYLVLSVSVLFARLAGLSRLFAYIGSMSLYVLIFHGFIQSASFRLFERLFGHHPYFNSVPAYAVAIVVPLLLGELIKRSNYLSLLYRPLKINPLLNRA